MVLHLKPPRIRGRARLFCREIATPAAGREKSYNLPRILGLRAESTSATFLRQWVLERENSSPSFPDFAVFARSALRSGSALVATSGAGNCAASMTFEQPKSLISLWTLRPGQVERQDRGKRDSEMPSGRRIFRGREFP